MNKNHLLWILLAANVFLTFASVGAEAFFGWTLPPGLAEYRHGRFAGFSITNVFHFLLLIITASFAFAAWIGLACFWRYGRSLYLASCVLSLLLTLLSGPKVLTSVGAMFRMSSALVGGAILGLVYFSDLARRFEGGSVTSPAGVSLGTDRA